MLKPGENTYMADIWMFNGTYWSWEGGVPYSLPAEHGTQGVPNSLNTPGTRTYSCTWIAGDGAVWLFGGMQYPNVIISMQVWDCL